MANFTNPRNLNPQDEFLDNANFDQDDWDLPAGEDLDFDPDNDNWSQVGMNDLDFDDMDDSDEDLDDFSGVF